MKIVITQLNEPAVFPAIVRNLLVAAPGGQSGATLLPGKINIFTTVASGNGARLDAGIPRQEVMNRGAFDLLVYPTAGTAIEGYGGNIPTVVSPMTSATFTFDGVSKWLVS